MLFASFFEGKTKEKMVWGLFFSVQKFTIALASA